MIRARKAYFNGRAYVYEFGGFTLLFYKKPSYGELLFLHNKTKDRLSKLWEEIERTNDTKRT